MYPYCVHSFMQAQAIGVLTIAIILWNTGSLICSHATVFASFPFKKSDVCVITDNVGRTRSKIFLAVRYTTKTNTLKIRDVFLGFFKDCTAAPWVSHKAKIISTRVLFFSLFEFYLGPTVQASKNTEKNTKLGVFPLHYFRCTSIRFVKTSFCILNT